MGVGKARWAKRGQGVVGVPSLVRCTTVMAWGPMIVLAFPASL